MYFIFTRCGCSCCRNVSVNATNVRAAEKENKTRKVRAEVEVEEAVMMLAVVCRSFPFDLVLVKAIPYRHFVYNTLSLL